MAEMSDERGIIVIEYLFLRFHSSTTFALLICPRAQKRNPL